MKVYALVNTLNGNGEKLLMKEGVKDKSSIYPFDRYRELYEILEPNDRVVVTSIKVFGCISNMAFVLNGLIAVGVSFVTIHEPKLSFTAKIPLKSKYKDFIMGVLNNEEIMINRLQQRYHKQVNVNDMVNWIHILCLTNLSNTFKADSILQR